MSELKKYCEALHKYYDKKYPIKIIEMMSEVVFSPMVKKDGTPKLKKGEEIYKTSWKVSLKYDPTQYPNDGTYGYLFVENNEKEEIVNMGETQNANSRPTNYNCVSFNKEGKPLTQKSNGSTNIGKNILMVDGVKKGTNYKLILISFGECLNEFGERMIAPSQEKNMSILYKKITNKEKPLWNGQLKKLVEDYKSIFIYGQKG
jgi:hypothetical protein